MGIAKFFLKRRGRLGCLQQSEKTCVRSGKNGICLGRPELRYRRGNVFDNTYPAVEEQSYSGKNWLCNRGEIAEDRTTSMGAINKFRGEPRCLRPPSARASVGAAPGLGQEAQVSHVGGVCLVRIKRGYIEEHASEPLLFSQTSSDPQ